MVIGPAAALAGAVNLAVGFASPGVSVGLALAVVLSLLWLVGNFVTSYTFGAAPRESPTAPPGVKVNIEHGIPVPRSNVPETPPPDKQPSKVKWALAAVNVVVLFVAGLVTIVNGSIEFIRNVA
jgi:hypothetical protein